MIPEIIDSIYPPTITFNEILANHNLSKCPEFLWKIKVTDEEYERLHNKLIQKAKGIKTSCTNRFKSVEKECALYVAEFWRRDYLLKNGAHSLDQIYKSLDILTNDCLQKKNFKDSAINGFNELNLERIILGNNRKIDSMLYQGGLPMFIIQGNTDTWTRFAQNLVNKRIDIDELQLGTTAQQSSSIKAYCEQLILSIENRDYNLMPFYCTDENNVWYKNLLDLADQELNHRGQLRPFSLDWEFKINTIDRIIKAYYIVYGKSNLPSNFLEENNVQNQVNFAVRIRRNNDIDRTIEYKYGYCYSLMNGFRHECVEGDTISLFIGDCSEAFIKKTPLEGPYLLYRQNDVYKLGNKIGVLPSVLLFSNDWKLEHSGLTVREYTWNDTTLSGVEIPENFKDELTILNEEDTITYTPRSLIRHIEIQRPLNHPEILEPIYDANSSFFNLCSDSDDGETRKRIQPIYRGIHQREWSDVPPYGLIWANAANEKNVKAVRFINVGADFDVKVTDITQESCTIQIAWPHGSIKIKEGQHEKNNLWRIKKSDCEDSRKIHIEVTPNGDQNAFELTMKAPFREFSILNMYGEEVSSGAMCVIPFSDIDRYQYHLVGRSLCYELGNTTSLRVRRWVQWLNEVDKLMISGDNITEKRIHYDGSLTNLFDSREEIRALLEQTSRNLINAEVSVCFKQNGNTFFTIVIKEFPVCPWQNNEEVYLKTAKTSFDTPVNIADSEGASDLIDTNDTRILRKNQGVLKLMNLTDPTTKIEEISFNEEKQCYVLPETIRPWGDTLLFGRSKGRIRPILVNLAENRDGDERRLYREKSLADIKQKLSVAKFNEPFWTRVILLLEHVQEEDIPASSILEFECISQNPTYLVYFTFQLYCSKHDMDFWGHWLLDKFSDSLAFQWYWLKPLLPELRRILFMDNNCFVPDLECFASNAESFKKKIEDISDLIDLINNQYTPWLKQLCSESISRSYSDPCNPEVKDIASAIIEGTKLSAYDDWSEVIIDNCQSDLKREVTDYFKNLSKGCRQNLSLNEKWLYQRVIATHRLLTERPEQDWFADQPDDIAHAIRRSIIYASKSCNTPFVKKLSELLRNAHN